MSAADIDIELLSDVSCAESSRTLGEAAVHECVPGRVLWGVLAGRLFAANPEVATRLLFGGGLRVLEARPVIDGHRASPIPKSWHRQKRNPAAGVFDLSLQGGFDALGSEQPVSVGSGWISPAGVRVKVHTRSSLRTALDEEGRAREALLFGIQSIPVGTRIRARLSAESEADLDLAVRLLRQDDLRIGRSRHAEFGLARVTGAEKAPPSDLVPTRAAILFLSRAGFRNASTGALRLVPLATDFGLPDRWRLVPERSFVRTSRHSPFNSTRERPESERQVIDAGSVVVFAPPAGSGDISQELRAAAALCAAGVGLWVGEGFGEVEIDPPSLRSATPTMTDAPVVPSSPPQPGDSLFSWAQERAENRKQGTDAYEWAAANASGWKPAPSQWGAVRELARRSDSSRVLRELEEHLGSGVTRGKWERDGARLVDLLKGWSGDKARALEWLADAATRNTKQNAKGGR